MSKSAPSSPPSDNSAAEEDGFPLDNGSEDDERRMHNQESTDGPQDEGNDANEGHPVNPELQALREERDILEREIRLERNLHTNGVVPQERQHNDQEEHGEGPGEGHGERHGEGQGEGQGERRGSHRTATRCFGFCNLL